MKIRLKDVPRFQELLIKNGYSQRGFGRAIGISEPYANQIANGERNPGPKVAKDICEALKVGFDDIFFIDSADKSHQDPKSQAS
ncbi:MAG: helix-turn-helix transcriptional regulator [Clostridia bacterium]|nr:helix-turn-helix transcriptional regulator [Clostridia bacterium]